MVSLYIILTTLLETFQGFLSPTSGIKAYGGVRQGGEAFRVPFLVRVGTNQA